MTVPADHTSDSLLPTLANVDISAPFELK